MQAPTKYELTFKPAQTFYYTPYQPTHPLIWRRRPHLRARGHPRGRLANVSAGLVASRNPFLTNTVSVWPAHAGVSAYSPPPSIIDTPPRVRTATRGLSIVRPAVHIPKSIAGLTWVGPASLQVTRNSVRHFVAAPPF